MIVSDPSFDFSTVTGSELSVTCPNGMRHEWDWAITPGSGQVTLEHVFAADGTDVDHPGMWTIRGWILTASSRRRIKLVRAPAEDE